MTEKPSYEALEQKVKELEKAAHERDRVEKSLLHEKYFSRSIIDSLPGVYYYFNKKGQFLGWNKNLEEISEYSAEEISKMHPLDFFVEEDKSKVSERISETFAKGRSFVEAVLLSKSGNKICLHLTGRLLQIDNKRYLVGMGIDITKRKRAEKAIRESEQFLGAIFNSIQDGISVLDPELNIIRVNKAMKRWYAHKRPLEGKKCYEVFYGQKEICEDCPTLRALASGKLEMHEVYFTHAEGDTGTLELFSFPMMGDSGKPTAVIEYARDITERKKAEASLRDYAEKIKSFAYSVLHDLKNPAVGVHLLTKALQKNYSGILDEKGKNYCNLILKTCEHLVTLVEQINLFITTRKVPLNIECVNLNQVFDTIRDEFSNQIIVRQINWLQPKKQLEINVDRLAILRVLRNFVDNALKYGGEKLRKIEIGYEKSDDFHILFVKDDGIGIEITDSEKIFNHFSRGTTARGIQGSGLGLAIAHEIAEQHKGRAWVEKGPGEGSVFCISVSKDIDVTA